MKFYLHAFKNFANFDDRASRTEYWMFFLFNTAFVIILYSVDLIFDLGLKKYGFGILYWSYVLISFVPGLALAVRRMHDLDKSGWLLLLLLIPLANLYVIALLCTKSDEEGNAFGEKPVNSDIAEFINNDKTCSTIVIISLIWLFVNRLSWTIISKSIDEYYKNDYFKYYSEFNGLTWSFFPLFLSLAVKNRAWKIVLLILSLLYMFVNFYDLVQSHLQNNHFQF
ncbi:DUF805 domain-containing protein [Flavobacterium sp.]|uniref:DUF805 domain-containing protein n=1 Tax=Flavobacterium sp. TaxID=239 RepID=UPI00374FF059